MAPPLVSTRRTNASGRRCSLPMAEFTPLSRAGATFRPPIRAAGSWDGAGTEPTLAALPANQLDDRQPSPPATFLLDTIWMSGAGPASDEFGKSDLLDRKFRGADSTWTDTTPCSGTATGTVPTSVPCSNIQESVVKLKGDLTGVTGLFSPNAQYGSFSPDTLQMDQDDEDLGSGGVLLAPQRGSAFFAAIAGKDGRLFLFDRSGTGLKFLQLRQGSACWCAPSYFTGPDGVARIVTSQGQVIQTFKIPATSLSPEGTSNRFHWTRPRLLHHGFVPRQRRIRQLREYADHLGGFTSHIEHIRCRPLGIFGFGGKRELPAALRSDEGGILAKYRRQREYRSDCLEWAGLCRFLEYPGDTEPRRNGRRRRAACGRRCARRRPFRPTPLSKSPGRFIASMGRCSPSQIAMAKRD